jgi:histidine ammonia-lyase
METFFYGKEKLTIEKAIMIAKGACIGKIDVEIEEKVNNSAQLVQKIVDNKQVVYGINTGFGPLCDTLISAAEVQQLQHNLIISHAVGVGNAIELVIAKLMLICKVQALAFGYSGVTLQVIERIIWHIENDIIPFVPEKGSVGASGDLAPLSHLFLPLIGKGKVWYNNEWHKTEFVLQQYNLKPLVLQAKEGLGLINGTQFILANAVWGMYKMEHLANVADVAGALSLEAFMGSTAPFKTALHDIRNYKGTQLVATRLQKILSGSEIVVSHQNCDRVQDPYSIRCMPQVHGASRNALQHLAELIEVELNSVTDNPVILNENEVISGGNFHGQPLAMAIDYATVATAELGNISDRRCYLLLEGKFGLPKLLMQNTGINSGFMIPQYTTAALVTENKTMCFPASADSIPTSLGQEDHVSMGSISARKWLKVIENLEHIFAIELLYGYQAISFRAPLKTSVFLQNVINTIATKVDVAVKDKEFYYDIQAIHQIVSDEQLRNKFR